jgi:hypothetical protein
MAIFANNKSIHLIKFRNLSEIKGIERLKIFMFTPNCILNIYFPALPHICYQIYLSHIVDMKYYVNSSIQSSDILHQIFKFQYVCLLNQ